MIMALLKKIKTKVRERNKAFKGRNPLPCGARLVLRTENLHDNASFGKNNEPRKQNKALTQDSPTSRSSFSLKEREPPSQQHLLIIDPPLHKNRTPRDSSPQKPKSL
ncbi:hypothetical protein TY91_11010 [Secundilactobacillus collinoides]|uniref:Uncharacterized protein n=1 Tax=Secundilactobacillus collinoides TaxID=33960 RepID=A0A161VH11_SECCO|nr:hypothetical protein TY91_11010 [Secundilactobacillus collinoides]